MKSFYSVSPVLPNKVVANVFLAAIVIFVIASLGLSALDRFKEAKEVGFSVECESTDWSSQCYNKSGVALPINRMTIKDRYPKVTIKTTTLAGVVK